MAQCFWPTVYFSSHYELQIILIEKAKFSERFDNIQGYILSECLYVTVNTETALITNGNHTEDHTTNHTNS